MSSTPSLAQAAALAWANQGHPVLPVRPDKTPLTKRGLADARTDPQVIAVWWSRWPDALAAVRLDYLLLVDRDSDEAERQWHQLVDEHADELIETVQAITPRGRHDYFVLNGFRPDRATGRLGLVEWRAGEGAYAVVPPGPQRRWLAPPSEGRLAEAPAWLKELVERRSEPVAQITEGVRNTTLTSLAGTMRRRGMTEDAILAALRVENAGRTDQALPDRELERIAASVGRYPPADAPTAARPRFTTRGVDLGALRPVRFTYRPFVVKGRLNLMAGEEDAGKSTLQAWIAARLTKGELPGEHHGQPVNVLFVGADEDDWNEIVVPRLVAAGADLARVFEFCGEQETAVFNVVDHVDALNRVLREGDYGLVIFEQLMDVLPSMKNAHDPVALRAALRPLRQVLRVREAPGLGTLHVNKAEVSTLRQKMQGSVQLGALSRSTVLIDRHPADEGRRVAVLGKANYVKDSESRALSFAIESHTFLLNDQGFDVGRVTDVAMEDLKISDVLRPPSDQQRERDERLETLAEALTEEVKTGVQLAEETEIPQATVYRLMPRLVEEERAVKVEGGWTVLTSQALKEVGDENGALSVPSPLKGERTENGSTEPDDGGAA